MHVVLLSLQNISSLLFMWFKTVFLDMNDITDFQSLDILINLNLN